MVIFKKIEVRDASLHYGDGHKSIFANELIKKGEKIFSCSDTSQCSYFMAQNDTFKTEAEIDELVKTSPEHMSKIMRYIWMSDDDQFNFPSKIFDADFEETKCIQCFLNHSCSPTGVYLPSMPWTFVAVRDIQVGEQITCDYQTFDTEPIRRSMHCKCGTRKCRGLLRWDYYRHLDWQMENYQHCSPYVQRKIDELRTKWFTSSCYLKYYIDNEGKRELGLTTLCDLTRDDLIAVFSSEKDVNEKSHYIRHSSRPTCFLVNKTYVYPIENLSKGTEITLDFEKKE